jgi:hypothetical protein
MKMGITFFIQFMFAFFIALVFALALVAGLGRAGPGPWSGLLFFMFLLFLMAWAGGLWLPSMGPRLFDVALFPFVATALIGILLFAAVIPHRSRGTMIAAIDETERRHHREDVAGVVMGSFYWIVVILLVAAIVKRF